MVLYSCIDKIEYETLMDKGILECDPKLVEMPSESVEVAIAYKYMADKLRARYRSNLIYPRWGWYQYEGKDMECFPSVFFVDKPNKKYYRLKLDVKEYLLSDFDAWHSCLNLYPLSYSEDEWQEYCYYLDVAKLDSRDVFVKDNVYNCITVCNQCHDEIHSRNYRKEKPSFSFDADGNFVYEKDNSLDADKKYKKEYTAEQKEKIKYYQSRLKAKRKR